MRKRKVVEDPKQEIATFALMKAGKSLRDHGAAIQYERDPEKLRKIAEYVRNCAFWIDHEANRLTPTPNKESPDA